MDVEKRGKLTVGVLLQIGELVRGQLGLTFTHFCAFLFG